MDQATILASLDFSRARLNGTLDAIEKAGQDPKKVLGFRPGPGRAHIGWQFMHCAATHDRYLNVRLKGGVEADAKFVATYAGGSMPSDQIVPTFAEIRERLEATYKPFREYVASQKSSDMDRQIPFPNNTSRSLGESLILMAWHEAHHQGQIHITWNIYKAANGIK
jgi:DinB superfamily